MCYGLEVGSGDEGFVFCFLRGGFCGESFGLGVSVFDFLGSVVVLGLAAVIGFSGGDFGLGNMAIGGLLYLCDFLIFEVPVFSTLFSLFTFFTNSCINTSVILFFLSFLFCFASISLYVCLSRVSLIPFFLQVSNFPEVFLGGF
ncbi:hypothetical protein Hanom_Chr08g00733861 [Helianthus anomalus]